MSSKGALDPIVLIPRFTTYIGTNTTFETGAIDVSRYGSGVLIVARGPQLGTSPNVDVLIQDSEDGVVWNTLTTAYLNPATSEDLSLPLTRRWLRAKVALFGTNAAVTCWCTGLLERRV
jgi:hypothetical protein